MKEWLGWHFLKEDRRLGFNDGRLVEVGKTYEAKGKLVMCCNGMHASSKILDALEYAPGPICCRVELMGTELIEDSDRAVARARRVIAMVDATKILHEFACCCAEDALRLVDTPDPRSVAAIQVKRVWLEGKISDADLAATWEAARAATWAAAREAARAAARDAARDAARAAARAATWAATKDAQNKRLTEMILEAMRA